MALNTGMRRRELFNLQWSDGNSAGRLATIVGKTAKSLQTRHIPLNDEIFDVLKAGHQQRKSEGLVFPGPQGSRMSTIKTSWARLMREAKISDFRFHGTILPQNW